MTGAVSRQLLSTLSQYKSPGSNVQNKNPRTFKEKPAEPQVPSSITPFVDVMFEHMTNFSSLNYSQSITISSCIYKNANVKISCQLLFADVAAVVLPTTVHSSRVLTLIRPALKAACWFSGVPASCRLRYHDMFFLLSRSPVQWLLLILHEISWLISRQ